MSTANDNAAPTLPVDAPPTPPTPQLPDPGNVLNQMPVSSPDGTLGVIPHEDWEKASAKGFKKAVFATSPDGKLGVLHPEDTPKAIQQGFHLGQPTPKTSMEEGSDAWYASKIPEPVMSVLSTIGKAFSAKDKAVHVAGDLAAAVPDLAVTPSGPDLSEVAANTKMAIAKGTHYSPTMPSDEEINTAVHNAEVKHPIAMGVSRAIARTGGEMVADPLNWPFFASGGSVARPALQKLISAGFATQMGAGTVESAKHLYDNWDQMSPEQRAEYATQTGLQGLFTGMAAKHAGSEVAAKGLEAGKEIAQKGTQALVQSRPVQAITDLLKPADKFTPEQAITKAAVPKGKLKAQWRTAVAENPQTMADARRAADNLGINIEQMTPEDARDAAQQAKKDIWSELQTNHPTEGGSAPTQGIADQIRKSVTQRSKEGSSGWVKEALDRAASYDERQMPLAEIEDRVSELNNKTRGIEAMFPSDKSAAKLQPENRPIFAERDALRELLLNRLDEMTGPGARELRKRYGNLGVLESALSRRVEDLASKSTDESELWKLGKIRSAGKIVRGVTTAAGSLAGGSPLGVALGVGDVYSGGKQLQAQRMADIKRDPFWLTRKAFRDAKPTPNAKLSGPVRHPIAGLLKGAPIELGPAPEPEYIPPQPPPFFRTTRAQRLGLSDTTRMQGVPKKTIVDATGAPAGRDVLENRPTRSVIPLGPTGKTGVLKRPFFLKGNVESGPMSPEKGTGENSAQPKQQTPAGAYETGKPATIQYTRNTEGAAQYAPGGKYDEVVPGRYMVERPEGYKSPDARWQTGSVEFKKPLVLDFADGAWKSNLSQQYGGKTGNALTSALQKDGYDGIITQDKYGTSEIVDLSSGKSPAHEVKPAKHFVTKLRKH